jgi:hypothetical protein
MMDLLCERWKAIEGINLCYYFQKRVQTSKNFVIPHEVRKVSALEKTEKRPFPQLIPE